MASRLPWFRMHQDDWLADPALAGVSLVAEGAWIRVVCAMRRADRGTLSGTLDWWARFLKQPSVDAARAILGELRDCGVGDVSFDGDSATATSRRVTRDLSSDEKEREQTAERTREYRARRRDAPVTPLQRSCDARVTLENQNQNQNQKEEKKDMSPAAPPTVPVAPSEPPVESKPELPREPTVADRVFAAYLAAGEATDRPHHGAVLTDKRRRLVAARLREGFTEQQLLEAIAGYHRSPFHRGENDDHRVHLAFDLILRDAKHVEDGLGYLERHRAGPAPPSGSAGGDAFLARFGMTREPEEPQVALRAAQ